MMEAESVPATFSSPSPPSFLSLTGLGALTPLGLFFFFQDVTVRLEQSQR